VIGGKARSKETTKKTKSRWVDNIKTNLGEIGFGGSVRIGLAQGKDKWKSLVNAVMNLRIP
jgi:hypothetical protein